MASPSDAGPPRPIFRMRRIDRLNDALFLGLARLGVGPAWSLTTRGRRTGQLRKTPVIAISKGGRLWLVAPYGEVAWVHNARAAGLVHLSRGRTRGTYRVRQVSAEEAGPVLQQYVQIASATRGYFAASVDAPVADFAAEANQHPVLSSRSSTPVSAHRHDTTPDSCRATDPAFRRSFHASSIARRVRSSESALLTLLRDDSAEVQIVTDKLLGMPTSSPPRCVHSRRAALRLPTAPPANDR